jgi:hypothetical protein
MVSTKYFCQNCKRELNEDQKPCPYCGSIKRDIDVEMKREEIKSRDSLRGRQKRNGFKKFMIEFLQGWFPSKNESRFPDGVQKERVINKEGDRYQEKVTNATTGAVVVNKDGKLSEHKRL